MRSILVILGILLVLTGVCGAADTPADELYSAGMKAFEEQNYGKAMDLFNQSMFAYDQAGNVDAARDALKKGKRAFWMLIGMDFNETQARDAVAAAVPQLSPSDMDRLFEPGGAIRIESGGQTMYNSVIVDNAAYHNSTLMQDRSRKENHSAFFDEVFPMILENKTFDGWYGNPHTFIANRTVSIPREILPEKGTLKVWISLPVETDSQNNISILTLQPEKYIRSGPVTTGDLGQVYFEIPLEEMKDPFINMSAVCRFTTYERRFTIDPETIKPYDTTSDLYGKYTASQPNIELNQQVVDLARKIVGDESNPYRKAQLIYEYIIHTYPYSHVSHTSLAASGTPESTFMLETGFGDCATQSTFFTALCRSAGVPARAPGGYQVVPGIEGTHFWAEFYLPGYGWIPADVTIAEGGDWAFNKTDEELNLFKDYYFGNLDPYRYTIQNDVDVSFSPDPGDDIIMNFHHQFPAMVCNESREDVEQIGINYQNITFYEE